MIVEMNCTEDSQWLRLLGLPANASALQVCQAFEPLAHRLAPLDFGDWPFYCMPIGALPPRFTGATNHCVGWYSDRAYFWMRGHLPADRGPGPAVVVRDCYSASEIDRLAAKKRLECLDLGVKCSLAEVQEVMRNRADIDSLCRTLTHELGHAIDSLADGEFECWTEFLSVHQETPKIANHLARQFDHIVVSAVARTEPSKQLDFHGPRFTRIMAHLHYRLKVIGVEPMLNAAGDRYEQAPFADCCAALGNEPHESLELSFREILSQPMPTAFEACSRVPAMALS